MVTVLEGRLARTWHYALNEHEKHHTITLFHDTITGLRSAMLDFTEIPNSFGNSSLFIDSNGHKIPFTIDRNGYAEQPIEGYILIQREGWIGFVYSCVIQGQEIKEATQTLSTNSENDFKVSITGHVITPDEMVENGSIVWYIMNCTRTADNTSTTLHRRFKDFSDMFSQVKQNLKGNHLRSSLPEFPEKTLKFVSNYLDPVFIEDRQMKLSVFMQRLICVPHVASMTCVKVFLGIMDQIKEYSISFDEVVLGISLVSPERASVDNPALVGAIQNSILCQSNIRSGDAITKLNGVPVSGLPFSGVISRIKSLPRPLILHFVQVSKF